MPEQTPSLNELYQLAEHLELDREVPVQLARERDHQLAASCPQASDVEKLRRWLQAVSGQRWLESPEAEPWLTEASAAALGRLLALFFGFSGMAAFLLGSGRGLVNVFVFGLLFVIVQLLLCLLAAAVMTRTVAGAAPVVLPVNPARFLLRRVLPDRRYLAEAQSVLRLVFLRYGQELGAIFTLGAIAAFFVVLALSDFTFVWGSTFQLSDTLVENMTAWVAAPWSAWLPQATISSDLIFASRFHPAVTSLSPDNIDAMRGWWPFLIMAMLCYALLPRLLLWLLSRIFYRRQIRAAFIRLPGSERVLARMNAPLVRTQGDSGATYWPGEAADNVDSDHRLLLLNWANALRPEDISQFAAFAAVPKNNVLSAGVGPLQQEMESVEAGVKPPVDHVLVAVKAWEPPMADLADFLAAITGCQRCTLYLVPLPNKPVSANTMGDWQLFARGLVFPVVDVQALEKI